MRSTSWPKTSGEASLLLHWSGCAGLPRENFRSWGFPQQLVRLRLLESFSWAKGDLSRWFTFRSRVRCGLRSVHRSRLVRIIDFPVSIHHGSLAKPARITAERALKEGEIKGLVATSSLELGIDVGRIDYVIQYMSPHQV